MKYVSILALSLAFAASAQAAGQGGIVRSAQEQLNSMGFYAGAVDGVAGEQTQAAVREFQRVNGLAVTGSLTPETYSLIGAQHDGRYGYGTRYTGYYGYHYGANGYAPYRGYNGAYQNVAYNWDGSRAWNGSRAWDAARAYALPIRFGNMVINHDGASNYTVTLNGQPVLHANNQPAPLKVSKTYSLSGEDAVILTAYSGTSGCAYKNYLVTVKNDGTYIPAQEIGNCSGNYEARVDGNQLFVSFPKDYAGAGDNWRYGYSSLVRL